MKAVCTIVTAAVAIASAAIAAPLELSARAPTVYTQCKNPKQFALTFDDGPYKYESKLVSELNSKGVTGTFFVNGNNYDCIYDVADSLITAYNSGHIIGSHTWTHADITTLSASQLNQQLDQVETALQKILGIKPRIFRPPYGSYNDASLEVLQKRGYSVVTWSLDSGDSTGHSTDYGISQYKQQARRFPAPGIGLNHETYAGTVDTVIPQAIQTLQQAGYQLVGMDKCLGLTAYDQVGGKTSRDSSWHC